MEELSLADVQVDALSCITEWLDGISIGRLWFSGSSKLRFTMSHGGVRRFDVDLGRRRTKFVFPALVAQFLALEHFNLSQTSKKYTAKDLVLHIAILPRTLRTLGIFCPFNLRSFATTATGRFEYLPLSEMLPHLYKLSISAHFTPYPEFAAQMVNLRELRISTPVWVADDFFAALPRSLEVIDVGCEAFNEDSSHPFRPMYFPGNPSSLTWYNDWNKIGQLPVSLTSLKLVQRYHGYDEWYDSLVWKMLPLTLTELSIPISPTGAMLGDHSEDLTPYLLELPPALVHLTLLERNWCSTLMAASFIPALPTGLQSLHLVGLSLSTDQFALLPRTLTSLEAAHSNGFVLANIRHLPPSLTHLKLHTDGLESTELGFGSLADYEAMKNPLKPFPPRLTSLAVVAIDAVLIPLLPPCITKLELENIRFKAGENSGMEERPNITFHPKSQILSLGCSIINPIPLIQMLPNTLTSLRLEIPRHTIQFGNPNPNFAAQDFPADWTKFLPRSLVSMHLSIGSFAFNGDDMFKHLPELEILELNSMGPPVDSARMFTSFDVFPKSLITLKVNVSASMDNMKIYEVLPPKLETLSIKNSSAPIPIDRQSFDIMPQTLVHISLPWISTEIDTRYTEFCLKQFGVALFWHRRRSIRRMIS